MIRYSVAFPAGILLLNLAIPSAGQTLDDNHALPMVARVPQSQTPADVSHAILVRPELSDEQLGDLSMARKEYREAAEIYKRLTDQAPRNPVYLNKLGIAMHQQTALAVALKCYERAVKADPMYADAENNIGTIWYQRKKYGKAIKAYQKAIAMRNDMAVLYSNLGYAYFGEKKYEESISSFRQALALDPQLFDHSGSRSGSILQDRSVGDRGRFYFLLAKSFAEAGNFERCLMYLRKAKDEGYATLNELKTDPAFAAFLKEPAILEILAPKPVDDTRP
jgi:tetratricopeptide (TPR) repeat protein